MAQRRMFSLQVVDTDAFMDMPLSSQALYFHLGMRADDDGFLGNARRVQRLVGASDDDFKILLMKRFILTFESGVIVIRHWRTSNIVRKDRYHPTVYQEEKAMLFIEADGTYTDYPAPGATPCLPSASEPETSDLPEAVPDVGDCTGDDMGDGTGDDAVDDVGDNVATNAHTNAHTNRIPSIGKVRLDYFSGGGGSYARASAKSAVEGFLQSRGKDPNAYFGMTPEIWSGVELLTRAIFKRFAARAPTEDDFVNAFLRLYHNEEDPETGEWTMELPQASKDLLLYAFEKAAEAGKPADWHYIDGILARLHQRGITTLAQADGYDCERNAG